MRWLALAVTLFGLFVVGPSLAARGGTLKIEFQAPSYDDLSISFYCLPAPGKGGLEAATAILLNGGPPAGQRMVIADGVATVGGEKQYCASLATLGTTEGAGRTAQVTGSRTIRTLPAGARGVRIGFRTWCPFALEGGSCAVRRPFVYRVRFAGLSAVACRTLRSSTSRLAPFIRSGGGKWGDQWRLLKMRGRFTHARPSEFVPAAIDRICGFDTPRAQRLGRELGLVATPPPPTSTFQLGTTTTYAHGGRGSNICFFVWTRPPQPPLRGSITMRGPNGTTKAFTTLGGDAKLRVVFTVAERGNYIADVTLAGKTTVAGAQLVEGGQTTSGEFACPAP